MQWEKAGGAESSKRRAGKKRGLMIGLVAVVALLVLMGVKSCGSSKEDAIDWPQSGLATMLPAPKSPKGILWENTDTTFKVDLREMPSTEREAYIEGCKEKGFTVDAVSDSNSYVAYNEDGCRLDLLFLGDESLDIELSAPLEMNDIAWPSAGPAAQVPAPPSLKGSVTGDRDDYYAVMVGSMDKSAFAVYAAQCRDAGFNVDFNMDDTHFYGYNAAGYRLDISYEGFKIVEITVSAPSEPVEDTTTAEEPVEQAPVEEEPVAQDGSFRAWVDEYEQFMNEYVDFMVEYANSGNAASMALDYAKWISSYGEMAAKAESVDDSQLSAEDAQYFLDAQNRVNQRLLEIA